MLAAWQMIFGTSYPLLLLGLTIDGSPLPFPLDRTRRFFACFISPSIGSSFTFLLLYWLMPRMSVTRLQTIALDHPAGSNRARLGLWWRTAFGLVASRHSLCSVRRVDDLPPNQRTGAGSGRSAGARLIPRWEGPVCPDFRIATAAPTFRASPGNRRGSRANATPFRRSRRPCWRVERFAL